MNVIPITEKKQIVYVPYYTGDSKFTNSNANYQLTQTLEDDKANVGFAWLPFQDFSVSRGTLPNKGYKQNTYQLLIRNLERAALPANHELKEVLDIIKQCVFPHTGAIRIVVLPQLSTQKILSSDFEDKDDYLNALNYELSSTKIENYSKYIKKFDTLIDSLKKCQELLFKYSEEFTKKYKVKYLVDENGREVDLAYLAASLTPSDKLKKRLKEMKKWLAWSQLENNTISISLNTGHILESSFKEVLSVPYFKDYPVAYAFIHLEDAQFSCGNWGDKNLDIDKKFVEPDIIILTEKKLKEQYTWVKSYASTKNLLIARYEKGELSEVKIYENSKTSQKNLELITTLLEKYKLNCVIQAPNVESGLTSNKKNKIKI